MSTVVKLISLADQIIKEWDKEAFLLSETEYIDLLSEIHKRICLAGKWFGEKSWGNEDMADDYVPKWYHLPRIRDRLQSKYPLNSIVSHILDGQKS